VAPISEADATEASGVYGSGALGISGDLFYQTLAFGATYDYSVLRRLSDDTALAVLRTPTSCNSASSTAAAPLIFEFLDTNAVTHWMGFYSPASGAFQPPAAAISFQAYTDSWFSWPGGLGFVGAGGGVDILLQGQTKLQFPAQGAGAQQGRAQPSTGMVGWLDQSTNPTTIRSWTPDGGTTSLLQGPTTVVALGLGDQNIAFLGVTGAMWQSGGYDTARIYWSPTATSSGGIQVNTGPDVSGQVAGWIQTMSTAGDYIAVTRTLPGTLTPDSLGVLVAQISTGKLWVLHSRPNMVMSLAAMSATEIFAYEWDYSLAMQRGDLFTQRWLRLDLTKLDQLVTTLPAGM
jgi:hypothetical protein